MCDQLNNYTLDHCRGQLFERKFRKGPPFKVYMNFFVGVLLYNPYFTQVQKKILRFISFAANRERVCGIKKSGKLPHPLFLAAIFFLKFTYQWIKTEAFSNFFFANQDFLISLPPPPSTFKTMLRALYQQNFKCDGNGNFDRLFRYNTLLWLIVYG